MNIVFSGKSYDSAGVKRAADALRQAFGSANQTGFTITVSASGTLASALTKISEALQKARVPEFPFQAGTMENGSTIVMLGTFENN